MADKATEGEVDVQAVRRAWHDHLADNATWENYRADYPEIQVRGNTITAPLTGRAAQKVGMCAQRVLEAHGITAQYWTQPSLRIVVQET